MHQPANMRRHPTHMLSSQPPPTHTGYYPVIRPQLQAPSTPLRLVRRQQLTLHEDVGPGVVDDRHDLRPVVHLLLSGGEDTIDDFDVLYNRHAREADVTDLATLDRKSLQAS